MTDYETITAANHRHDQQHGDPFRWARVRSGWNESQMMRRGELTDRRIEHYAAEGWYEPCLKLARRERAAKRTEL